MTESYGAFPVGGDHDRLISTSSVAGNAVTTSHEDSALVWGADLLGLARAVAETLDAPTLIAVADGETVLTGQREAVRFPDPVGVQDARRLPVGDDTVRVLLASGRDHWSALRVGGERTLALVDDGRFAAAAILAAAALLPAGAVWAHHDEFLTEARRLGLRFAQAVG